MTSAPKKPRRTAERILESALVLFNRHGEPNVAPAAIAADLSISPGNLYYHFPAKEALINALVQRHVHGLQALLEAADEVRHIEDAWLFFHMLFEAIWQHRFLYRDLNDLLSKNRMLESEFQDLLARKTRAVRAVLAGLAQAQSLHIDERQAEPVATAMVVVLSYWLNYEYVRAPRQALEPEASASALLRGAAHVLCLLQPYLDAASREHLGRLVEGYGQA